MAELSDLLDLRIANISPLGSDTLNLADSLYGKIVWYIDALYDSYIAVEMFGAGYLDVKKIEDIFLGSPSNPSLFDFDTDNTKEEFSLK